MRAFKLTAVILLALFMGAFLHYTLPRHEVVRIVGVTERFEYFRFYNRMFYTWDSGRITAGDSRDVRFIEGVLPSGRELVFRNEDTGFWPPYLKFDEADLQARARNLISTSDSPVWVRVTFYGIRSQLLSIFPNALRVQAADGPDDTVIPWTRLISFAVLIGVIAWIWLALRRFRERRLEPFLDRMDEKRERARGWLGRTWDRLTGR